MVFGVNTTSTTSDTSKLLYIISRAAKRVKFETILKYHNWYLYLVYSTTRRRFVIFTCGYFKLSWNTTALSQSNYRNFSCSSIMDRNNQKITLNSATFGILSGVFQKFPFLVFIPFPWVCIFDLWRQTGFSRNFIFSAYASSFSFNLFKMECTGKIRQENVLCSQRYRICRWKFGKAVQVHILQ